METISENWLDIITNEFDIRDSREKNCIPLVNKIQELQRYELENQNDKEEINQLKDNIEKLYISLGKKQSEIEEQKDMNKSLLDEMKEKTNTINQLEIMKKNQEEEINKLNQKDIDNQNLIDKKNDVIQVLQDELLAIKLELNKLEEKNEKLKNDNEIWIKKLKDQANKFAQLLNDQNAGIDESKKPNFQPKSDINFKSQDVFGTVSIPKVTSKIPLNLYNKIITGGNVNCVELSIDGKQIAVGIDKNINVYETESGRPKLVLSGLVKEVTSIDYNFKNDLILGTSFDKSIKIWNINGSSKDVLTGHTNKVSSAKFTIDNDIISCSQDRTVKLWSLNTGSCVNSIFTHSSCNDLDLLNNSGTMVVTAHLDNSLKIWDMHNKKLIQEVSSIHSSAVISVQVSPAQNEILSLSRDNTIKTIDIRMYKNLLTFRDDNLRIANNNQNSCYSADGKYVVCGSGNGSIFFFNTYTNKKEKIIKQSSSPIIKVKWDPFGKNHLYTTEFKNNVIYEWSDKKPLSSEWIDV